MTVPCTEVFENGEPDVYTPVDRIYVKNTDMKTITSVEDYCIQCEIYGEKISFIGYPTDTGFGSAMNLIGEVSINSKSENKDAAWEFVKYYVINGTTTGFPVYVPRYEEMLGNSLETNYSYDADTSEKIAKASYSEPNGVRLYVYSADAEDVDAVRKLVEKQAKNMNMKRTFN